MSQDRYKRDRYKHGGLHVDRYSPQGQLIGRYLPDKTPLRHMGITPPLVPRSDYDKFAKALAGNRTN